MKLSGPELVELSRLLRAIEDLDGDAREAVFASEVSTSGGALVRLARTLLEERDRAAPMTLPKLADLDVELSMAAAVAGLAVGQRVGNYRLQRELGRGGMSSVWLAERTDALTHRPIALKLPFAHQRDTTLAERLSRERDILASLTHPNIARLYDAGVTPERQPFLVLEFIDGVTINDYCRSRHLPIDERIDLVVQVLDAVGYAHSRQVIHRDLKPSNILVRGNGQVALLDFGIAKLLVDGATVETELTQHGGRALTLDYASPEQIANEPLGVASDLYSMGIVLYELLTGTRPYELRGGSRGALEDAILAAEVRLPEAAVITAELASERATTPRALRRQLRADLSAVLMKALRRSPADRYPTAGDFADDLRRYRRGDAVRARRYPWTARLRRFVVRRRAAIAGVGFIIALLIVAMQLWLASHHAQRAAVAAPPVAAEQSVAVLPFADLSAAHDQGDFADGLADELIGILSTVPGLHTAAHASTLALKNGQTDLRAIGAKLNVANVLAGSVRKVGGRMQVAVTLRRVSDERVLWSGHYDRSETDISRIQQDISAEVAAALKITLLNAGMSQHPNTANPAAYTLYLQARSIFSRGGSDNARRATEYLRESLSLDPKFAAAWATLSRIEHQQALDGWVRGNEIRAAATEAAGRAIALDPLLAEAHIALGESRFDFEWDWRQAEAEFDRALELDRGNAEALRSAADVALTLGKFARARDFAQRAILLDPLVALNYSHLARIELQLGELRAAQEAFRKALDLDPVESLHASLGIALLLDGQPEAALAEIERERDEEWREVNLPFAYYALHRARAAEAALARAKAKWADDAAFQIAEYYAYTGARRESLAWLARAIRQRDDGLVWIKGDPFLRMLEGDEEYRRLLDAIHIPP